MIHTHTTQQALRRAPFLFNEMAYHVQSERSSRFTVAFAGAHRKAWELKIAVLVRTYLRVPALQVPCFWRRPLTCCLLIFPHPRYPFLSRSYNLQNWPNGVKGSRFPIQKPFKLFVVKAL